MKAHVSQLKEQERRKAQFERERTRHEEDEVRQRIKEQESLTREIIQEEVQQNRDLERGLHDLPVVLAGNFDDVR